MAHSDCDGSLTPEHAGTVAAFLRWVAPRMEGETGGHLERFENMGAVAIQFAEGCEAAADADEFVMFG